MQRRRVDQTGSGAFRSTALFSIELQYLCNACAHVDWPPASSSESSSGCWGPRPVHWEALLSSCWADGFYGALSLYWPESTRQVLHPRLTEEGASLGTTSLSSASVRRSMWDAQKSAGSQCLF